jgi:predicted ester cyclase
MAAPSTPSTGADVARTAIDSINARDLEAIKSLWDADGVDRFPDRTCHGPDEIAAYFAGIFAAIPDFRLDIVALAEQGDTVFVQWRATGTHTGGPFQGIDPTGKAVALDGMDRYTIRNGKVMSEFVVFDQMDFGRQLGLLPPDGSAADRALKAAFNAATAVKAKLAR